MKKLIFPLASLSAALYAITLYAIVGSIIVSCQRNDLPAPAATGYGDTTFETVNEAGPGDFQLIGNLCAEQPRDLTLSVWYFPADTSPADALNAVANLGLDEDGEPVDAELPDDSFEVSAKYSRSTVNYSHYSASGYFSLYLTADQMAVVEVTDAEGRMVYKTVSTGLGQKLETCFSF